MPVVPGGAPGPEGSPAGRPAHPSARLCRSCREPSASPARSPAADERWNSSDCRSSPEGVETWIFRGGINHRHPGPAVRHHRHRGGRGRDLARAPRRRRASRSWARTARPGSTTPGSRWKSISRATWSSARTKTRSRAGAISGPFARPGSITTSSPTACWRPTPKSTCSRPSLLAPIKIKSPRLEQFRRPGPLPNGTYTLAEQPEIRLEPSLMTGSRFPNPGYKISSNVDRSDAVLAARSPTPTRARKSATRTT